MSAGINCARMAPHYLKASAAEAAHLHPCADIQPLPDALAARHRQAHEPLRTVALGVLIDPSHVGHLHLRNLTTRGYFLASNIHVPGAPDVLIFDEVPEAEAEQGLEFSRRARQSLRDELGL